MWGQVKQLLQICMYALKTAGYQSALMVPTEILAEQHANSLTELFGEYMNVALLTGSVKGKKKSSIRAIRKWYY